MKNIIKTKTLFGAGLTALAFSLILTSTAFAQSCAAVPTCDELGYNKTTCNGFVSLKCPFDKSKLFCGGTCESGYIYGMISGKCGTKNPDIIYSGDKPIAVVIDEGYALALRNEAEGTFQEVYDACDNKVGGSWTVPSLDAFYAYMQKKSIIDSLIKSVGGSVPSGNVIVDEVIDGEVTEYDMSNGKVIIDSFPEWDGFISRCFLYLRP